jgi:hypothetical protein
LPRTASFYFGTLIFFVGLLLLAVGVSRIINEDFNILSFAEVISGIVLMVVGYRATSRPVKPESPPNT